MRSEGLAFDDEEFSVGVRCVAAPVFRFDGAVCGSIGISGPSPRMSDARLSEWEDFLRDISREVSNRLGWDGAPSPASAILREGKSARDRAVSQLIAIA